MACTPALTALLSGIRHSADDASYYHRDVDNLCSRLARRIVLPYRYGNHLLVSWVKSIKQLTLVMSKIQYELSRKPIATTPTIVA